MTLRISDLEFKLLRDLIERECGIHLSESKAYLIENRFSELAKEFGCSSFTELYLIAKSPRYSAKLRRLMVDAITTKETSWFRDDYPYRFLRETLLPQMHREISEGKRSQIRFWSAGCSTGQEPYSIAIAVLEFLCEAGRDAVCHEWVHILATDVSQTSLSTAMEGAYDKSSISRGLPQQVLERYFRQEANSWVVEDKVKRLVTFKHFNLKDPCLGIGPFDAIFLRNVMIYFSEDMKRGLFDRLARTLVPGGYLFLGTGETVSGYSTSFHIMEHGGAIFYQLKPGGGIS
jgi:chemotaxis protein methyltransferase CheR